MQIRLRSSDLRPSSPSQPARWLMPSQALRPQHPWAGLSLVSAPPSHPSSCSRARGRLIY